MRAPLRYRIANPPSVFVGRQAEERLLRSALARGPIAAVCGDAGLGKSALVQAVLHDMDNVRVVRCTQGVTFAELGAEVLAALGAADGSSATFDYSSRAGDDALIEQVLAAAEAVGSVVVLEDVHALDAPIVTNWVLALASFARASRWVVTSRARFTVPSLQEQVVSLRGLEPAAARALAQACAPVGASSHIDAIVDAAGGSPLRVRELVAGLDVVAPRLAPALKLGELEAVLHGGDVRRADPTLRAPERKMGAALVAHVRRLLDEEHHEHRQSLGMRATVFAGMRLIAEGRAARGEQVLRVLQQSADVPAGLSLLVSMAQGLVRVTGGRYQGLPLASRELLREAEHLGNSTLYHWAFMFERLANLGTSADGPEPAWADGIPPPLGISARYLEALRVAHRARRGDRIAHGQLPRVQPGDGPLATCVCEFLETHVCLLGGDVERAEVLAATLVRRCVELRVLVVEGEALLMLCYAQLALGREDELRGSVEELARVGHSARSRRYTVLADLLRMALDPAPNVTRLLKIAAHGDASPTAARVARVLLGGVASGDALDRLLVDGLAARWQRTIQPLSEGEPARWAFDQATSTVFMPQRCEQASPLAIRILCCLFDAAASPPGHARLEEVASIAWDVSDYHPLRDAKRVHVAIRRLRTLIEDDPSAPTRLLTVDGGYALARAERPGRVVPAPPKVATW